MSNPNLTAKQVVDKNGKLTTVHVNYGKLDAEGKGNSTSGNTIWAYNPPPKLPSIPGVYAFVIETGRLQSGVILPRKRNPRDIHFRDHVLVDVPVLTEEELPTNFKVGEKEYRSYDGTLYTKYLSREGDSFEAETFFAGNPTLANDNRPYHSPTPDYDALYNEHANDYVVLDGEVWKRSGEPMYRIDTSSRMTFDVEVASSPSHYDRNENLFSANERELFLAKAQEKLDDMPDMSRGYGGQLSSWGKDSARESIANLPVIEVLDDSLIGSTYDFPSRISYPEFSTYEESDFNTGLDEAGRTAKIAARWQTAMAAYRQAFDSIPGAIEVQESGAKRINWSVIPDGLKYQYESASKWAIENGYLS